MKEQAPARPVDPKNLPPSVVVLEAIKKLQGNDRKAVHETMLLDYLMKVDGFTEQLAKSTIEKLFRFGKIYEAAPKYYALPYGYGTTEVPV